MWTPTNLNLEWILRIWTVAFVGIALTIIVLTWLLSQVRTAPAQLRSRLLLRGTKITSTS